MPSSVGVASRPEPAAAAAAPVAMRVEPATAPAVAPRPQAARPRKEAVTAVKGGGEKSGSVPTLVWFVIIAIVAVAAYMVGKAG